MSGGEIIDKKRLLYALFGLTEDEILTEPPDEIIERVLSKLRKKQRFVIERRFSQYPVTLKAIAELCGVTSTRIRQIEVKALRNLKRTKTLKQDVRKR